MACWQAASNLSERLSRLVFLCSGYCSLDASRMSRAKSVCKPSLELLQREHTCPFSARAHLKMQTLLPHHRPPDSVMQSIWLAVQLPLFGPKFANAWHTQTQLAARRGSHPKVRCDRAPVRWRWDPGSGGQAPHGPQTCCKLPVQRVKDGGWLGLM